MSAERQPLQPIAEEKPEELEKGEEEKPTTSSAPEQPRPFAVVKEDLYRTTIRMYSIHEELLYNLASGLVAMVKNEPHDLEDMNRTCQMIDQLKGRINDCLETLRIEQPPGSK